MDTEAEKWHFGDFPSESWNRCQTMDPYEIAMLIICEWIPFVRFRDMMGPKMAQIIAQYPLQTPVTRNRVDGYNRHFGTNFTCLRESHVFEILESPYPTPTTRLPAPSPITRLLLNRSQWNLACFYRMLRPWCLPNFIEIDWEMKELLGFKMPKQLFWGHPKKRLNCYICLVTRSTRAVFLRLNSAHYTRASGKITALCNKCEQGNLDLNFYHRDSLWILKPRNGTLVTFPQRAETGAKKWIPTK